MLKGPQAFELGIADVLFEPADFLEESLLWAATVLTGESRSSAPRSTATRPSGTPRSPRRQGPRRPQDRRPAPARRTGPSTLVAAARTATRDEAFAAEDEALADLAHERRAARRALLLRPRAEAGQAAGRCARQGAGPTVTKVGIVGAGLMASQLALLFARRLEVPVVLTDLDEERVAKGVGYVHAEVDKLLGKRRVSPDKANRSRAWSPGRRARTASPTPTSSSRRSSRRCRSRSRSSPRSRPSCRPSACSRPTPRSLSITEMAAELAAPGAGRRLPLLQPGRRDAAARDHPGRAHRRRHPRHGVRHRQDAEEDHASWSRTARRSSSTGSSAASWARSRRSSTRARRSRSPTGRSPASRRCRRSSCSGSSGRRSRCTTARRCARAFPDRFYVSPNLAAVVAAGKRGYLRPELGPSGARPRGRGALREAGRPGRARPRPGARAGARASWPTRRGGCSTRVSRRPRWTSTWR